MRTFDSEIHHQPKSGAAPKQVKKGESTNGAAAIAAITKPAGKDTKEKSPAATKATPSKKGYEKGALSSFLSSISPSTTANALKITSAAHSDKPIEVEVEEDSEGRRGVERYTYIYAAYLHRTW